MCITKIKEVDPELEVEPFSEEAPENEHIKVPLE